jgi:transposase
MQFVMRKAPPIHLTEAERSTLESWLRGRSTPARLVLRARIVLLAAEGQENQEIGELVGASRQTVGLWRQRFAAQGLRGIEKDAPRGGRPGSVRADWERRIIEATLRDQPINATHWSTRTLARALGVSRSLVHRVWQANGLKPHRVKTFKLSNDPDFIDKLLDVVGLYLDPPEHALVLVRTRNRRFKLWIGRNLGCRSNRGAVERRPMTTNATGRPPCLPLWRWRRGK